MRRVNAVISKLETSPRELLALDLDMVKLQRRIGSTTSLDSLFEMWIRAATSHFEEQTGRAVMKSPYLYTLDCPPPCDRFIEIPRAPLVEVLGIEYDSDGSPSIETFDPENYTVETTTGDHCAPGRIVLKSGASWPTPSMVGGAFRIQFTAGYADTSDEVPSLIRAALLYLVGHFHKYGEEVIGGPDANSLQQIPMGAAKIIEAFKFTAKPIQRLWDVPWLV